MNPLVPCPSCSRHVRASETACPFCASALSTRIAARAVPAAPRRLERLAVFTFAAAVAVTGCAVEAEDVSEQESELGGIQPMYGQPPPPDVDVDAGPAPDAGDVDAGPAPDGGDVDAGSPCDTPPADDGGIHAMYGAPAFEDIWTPCPVDEEDGGGIQPMYGMPAPEN